LIIPHVAAYLIAHKFVHGNEIALVQRVEKVGADLTVITTRDTSVAPLPVLSVWAARSALLALIATAKMMAWEVPSIITDLLSRCEDLQPNKDAPKNCGPVPDDGPTAPSTAITP
jgi:hypothetical protein